MGPLPALRHCRTTKKSTADHAKAKGKKKKQHAHHKAKGSKVAPMKQGAGAPKMKAKGGHQAHAKHRRQSSNKGSC